MKKLIHIPLVFILLICSSFALITKNTGIPLEGIQVVNHYMFGNGEDLILKSDYLPNSPVIKRNLKNMKVGQTKRIVFNQKEDWRLSYALNPFNLKKTKNGFEIYQYIKFDNTGNVFTYIKTPFGKIKVNDNIVHIKKCKPYMVRYYYTGSTF
jgi:hypothetical protein